MNKKSIILFSILGFTILILSICLVKINKDVYYDKLKTLSNISNEVKISVEIKNNNIYLIKNNVENVIFSGKACDTTKENLNCEVSIETPKIALLSPNNEFVYMRVNGWEWMNEYIYDIKENKTYKIENKDGSDFVDWLDNGNILLYGPGGMSNSGGIFISTNSAKPWNVFKIGEFADDAYNILNNR